MAQTRIKISSDSITETTINPIWSGEFSRSIERDRIYYTHELKGNLTLKGEDFTLVNDLTDDCEKVTVVIERFCGDEWVEYWRGYFSKFDTTRDFGGRDVPQCLLSTKVKTDDKYDCLALEWDDEVNFYSASAEISTIAFKGTYEILDICQFCTSDPNPPTCSTDTDSCNEYQQSNPNAACPPGEYMVVKARHRIIGTGTPTVPPIYGTGWTHLSGNDWWRCPDDEELRIGVLGRGRRWDATLEYFVSQIACGLTLRSHFFGINATHAAPPDNDAYDYATENYQNITIHQKSDVKRPFSSNPSLSQVWKMKFKTILADMQTMFNLFFVIDGDDLILEHISYFDSIAGADYSDKKMKLELDFDADVPRRELFKWADADVRSLFRAIPLTYSCGNGDKERQVTLFNTDVDFIHDILNQDRVNDDGWVLICNDLDGSDYVIKDLNYPLRWFNLLDKLHRHYRPFLTGNMNGEDTTFLSTQKIQKQPAFSVGLCCDDDFDPTKYVTTLLGQGRIKEATENIKKERLELSLNY